MGIKVNHLYSVLILLAICFGCTVGKTKKGQKINKKPNVLVIMCDQLNYKALSCYGGPLPTPNKIGRAHV